MKWLTSDTERSSGFVNDIVKPETLLHVNLLNCSVCRMGN